MNNRFNRVLLFCGAALAAAMRTVAASESGWQATAWDGERAYAAESGGWKAVISIERGRLIYFGAAGAEKNLLFAPPARDTAMGWGGHRVWCGPQERWPGGWPPPEAWEHSAAEKVTIDGARLVLAMPDSPDGWPRITREYFWAEGALHCRARLTGGTRETQIIQILQVPSSAKIEVQAPPTAKAPHGYVQVHLGRHPSPRFDFPAPPQVSANGALLNLKFTGAMEKLGFEPQPLRAKIDETTLIVARGASEGSSVVSPDDGFVTQVYFGSTQSALIELEQLSPLWAGGHEASFEMILKAE